MPKRIITERSLLVRLLWFAAIYAASVAAVGLVTFVLRRVLVG